MQNNNTTIVRLLKGVWLDTEAILKHTVGKAIDAHKHEMFL